MVRRWPRLRRRGFVLIEVVVAMVILGIALGTLMRSFTLSMKAIRQNDKITQGCVLAEGLLQDLELNPPTARRTTGDFEDLGFPEYSYEIEYTEEEIRYRGVKTTGQIDDLKPLRLAHVIIYFRGPNDRDAFKVSEAHLYLQPVERWSYQSKFLNELFREEM